MLNDPEIDLCLTNGELDATAASTMIQARNQFRSASAGTVAGWVEGVEAGHQDQGNMSVELLHALESLDGWAQFLSGQDTGVQLIATQLLNAVDFRSSGPDVDTWLANPEVAAEHDRIMQALVGRNTAP